MIYESKKMFLVKKQIIHTCMCLFILIISYHVYTTLYVHINIYIRNILSCTHEENINIHDILHILQMALLNIHQLFKLARFTLFFSFTFFFRFPYTSFNISFTSSSLSFCSISFTPSSTLKWFFAALKNASTTS